MEISVSVKGIDEVNRAIEGVESAVKKTRGALTDIGKYLTRLYSGQVFASRGGVIGESWLELKPQYAAYKARRWPGRPPLIKSGEMMASFRSDVGIDRVRIHNVAPHFRFHQLGEGVPQRAMMRMTSELRREVVRIADDHLKRAL